MFLSKELLPREVTIFPEKIKSFNILLKMHKNQHQIVKKAYQGSKRLNKVNKIARVES